MRNISVFGDISAGEGYQNRSNAGGIFGITATGKDSIRKVSSYGKVSGTSNRVGGLIGAVFSNISVSQSLHYGSIKGGINDGISNTGGAFGIIASEKAVLKPFVFSIGRVTAPGSKVGGFAGSAYKNTEITYAFSWGNVSGGNYTGGMVGDSSYTNMTYSWSFGPVKGEKATGGLIGKDLNGSITEMNTKSQVKGEDMTGGIAGIAYGTRIRRVTAKGDVKGKTAVGGFIGKSLNNTSIKLAYARGNVTGTENVAGFIGNNTGNVSQAYSTGKISALTGPTKNSFGGFIGVNKGNVENSYWDRQLSGMQKSASQAEGLSTQQMKTRRHLDGFNFFKHWVLISGVNDGYAVLRPQQPPTPPLPPPEVCGDNADNDGDGEIDENCSGFLPPQPPNLPEICADSVDNDNDGKTDEGCGGDIPDPGQGSNKTGSGISLSWNDNSQTEEGFRLYSNVSGEFRQIGNAAANSKSFKPPALPAPASGRHVCYRVTAYNQFGESAYSQDCIN